LPANGVGCFLAAPAQKLGADFDRFLAGQAAIQLRADDNTTHPRREVVLTPAPGMTRLKSSPAGMVALRPRPDQWLSIQMRFRECGFYDSMTEDKEGFADSYEYHTREFKRLLSSSPYAIDETPVTNAQFAEFLRASNYRPRHPENFLKHWSTGQAPAGKADHPVVWVDLDDARAFAAWAGKRLPTEEEWQFAAQGDGCEYPWGSGLRAGVCNLGETGDTTPVKAFPAGRSPSGCYDMCGNVWQWTESERNDSRTRFCIIRGGSYFAPQGSAWYVDGGPREANFATKFLLMWPGLDRCATIGFRCVADLEI
jgi:formylglycine-generating enzyme required for sulfatase activity